MIVIEDQEFNQLLWDIHNVPKDTDLRTKYNREFSEIFPHLVKNKSEENEANRLVRYIIYLYHKDTPLRKHIKNIDDRREYAAKLAGYNHKLLDKSRKTRVINQKDVQVVNTIICLIKYTDDKRYAQLISNELMFWEYHKRLMAVVPSEIDSKELSLRSSLRQEIKSLQDEIESLEYQLYGGDKEVVDLVREVRKIKTFPEHMAI